MLRVRRCSEQPLGSLSIRIAGRRTRASYSSSPTPGYRDPDGRILFARQRSTSSRDNTLNALKSDRRCRPPYSPDSAPADCFPFSETRAEDGTPRFRRHSGDPKSSYTEQSKPHTTKRFLRSVRTALHRRRCKERPSNWGDKGSVQINSLIFESCVFV